LPGSRHPDVKVGNERSGRRVCPVQDGRGPQSDTSSVPLAPRSLETSHFSVVNVTRGLAWASLAAARR
jgi:hypothetical protein